MADWQAEKSGNTVYRYKMEVAWSDADQSFLARVPELPGCMADGSTYEEAVANAQVIIGHWIETAKELGREVPQPQLPDASVFR